jgi:predicted lipid-binding transport protein (Tim44 family)
MQFRSSTGSHRWVKGLALVAAFALAGGEAMARAGGGKSSGSRGSFSRQAPPVTDTAPRQAQPLPGAQQALPGASAGAAAAAARAAQPSRFGPMLTGFAMGFLGAGLFGMLTGQGFLAGLGSLMGFLGFALQIALVFFLARMALNFWRSRQQPAAAAAGSGMARTGPAPQWAPAAGAGPVPAPPQPLRLIEADFSSFERLLGEIQDCYSRADHNGLNQRATPEMCRVFAGEIDERARQGLINRVSSVKLLQGDLSEAWREGSRDYATVAMRFALNDVTVEKATGRIVEGDPTRIDEATEIWTFVRGAGESPETWHLSAIQQV